MKKLSIILLLAASSAICLGQAKKDAAADAHRRVVKHSKTITTDSVYYAPDTIAVVFKELIIKPDTVLEKWTRGFVIWQTYQQYRTSSSSISLFTGSGSYFINSAGHNDDYFKTEFTGSDGLNEPYLYADRKSRVTNKVMQSLKQ